MRKGVAKSEPGSTELIWKKIQLGLNREKTHRELIYFEIETDPNMQYLILLQSLNYHMFKYDYS